ncbi:MAG: OB-fold nucleic acid binding domain-containing protein [Firmicutes bacterium]|nr:OB-fold nucleic acid binding domain-containing protein [Bacillota bacterium]
MDELLQWYAGIRLKAAEYDERKDNLTLKFIHQEEVSDEFKQDLEKWIEANLGDYRVASEFDKPYIDEDMLGLKIKNLLVGNWGVLLVGLLDEDIVISYEGGEYKIDLHLPQDVGEYIRQTTIFRGFIDGLAQDYFAEFLVNWVDKPSEGGGSIEELEKYMADFVPQQRVNKTMHIRGLEYYLGRPIKERPIRIEFLRISPHEQVIAGKIMFLAQKTFKKKTDDGEEEKPYWTFVLDDGKSRAQCVFFPNQKSKPLFEKLVDGTVIAAIGNFSERNGRTSFRVSGISFCEL